MAGDPTHGDAVAVLPQQHLGGQGTVLRRAVTGMAIAGVGPATIGGRHQADVEGNVVDRATAAGLGLQGEIAKGRLPGAVGTVGIGHHAVTIPIGANHKVVTHLIGICRVGSAEQVEGAGLIHHGLVQHDQAGLMGQGAATPIPALPLAEVGGICGSSQFRLQTQTPGTAAEFTWGELGRRDEHRVGGDSAR